MKRKTAKEILAASFRELAEGKGINKITIREIVDNCGYSPATFYRHFKDKYDLIAWEHTRAVAEIVDRTRADDYPWKQTLHDGARLYHEKRDYLVNLLRHTSGHDSFMRYMAEINCSALEKYILSVNGNRKLTHEETMFVKIYCHGALRMDSGTDTHDGGRNRGSLRAIDSGTAEEVSFAGEMIRGISLILRD